MGVVSGEMRNEIYEVLEAALGTDRRPAKHVILTLIGSGARIGGLVRLVGADVVRLSEYRDKDTRTVRIDQIATVEVEG